MMGEFSINIDLAEVKELKKSIDRLGKVPQKCVSSAAGKAGTLLKRTVKQGKVPVDTGALRRGIIRKAEKSRYKGKKVYEATFDAGMNDIFQKPIKNPGQFGGQSPKAYYPASQEYGYLTRSKGGGISYVPGLHFMSEGAAAAEAPAKKLMIDTLIQNIDKEWMKTNGT